MNQKIINYSILISYLLTCVLNVIICSIGIALCIQTEEYIYATCIVGAMIFWQILWILTVWTVLDRQSYGIHRSSGHFDTSGKLHIN